MNTVAVCTYNRQKSFKKINQFANWLELKCMYFDEHRQYLKDTVVIGLGHRQQQPKQGLSVAQELMYVLHHNKCKKNI